MIPSTECVEKNGDSAKISYTISIESIESAMTIVSKRSDTEGTRRT